MQRKMTWQLLLAALVSTLLLGGCTRTYTWKEEVTLKSGEKLIVERSQQYSTGGEWGTSTLWNTIEKARIRIDGVPVEWVGYNYPMIIERWGGTYVVIYIGTQCYSFSLDDPRRYVPPYSVEAFIDGKWQKVDVFEVREVWPRNLVREWREGGFLAVDQKGRVLRSQRNPSNKRIEAYDLSLPSGCGQMPSPKSNNGK